MDISKRTGPIPKDTRYIPLIQQRDCCLPACILMIMLKHKIPLIAQELLAYKLGRSMSTRFRKYFWNPRIRELWTSKNGEKIVNKGLEELRIPLRTKIIRLNQLIEPAVYLKTIEINNQDVLACFDYDVLYANKRRGVGHGHVVLIDRVDLQTKKVRLIDPCAYEERCSVWRVVKIKKLLKAIKDFGYYGGFWKFTLISRK